jgi:hypothetical protein
MISDDSLTAYISIKDFTDLFLQYLTDENCKYIIDESGQLIRVDNVAENFYINNGQRIEPKSDDLMEITALGCDRPGNRGAKIFRITEVLDQSVQDGINPMMGHYVYRITAKRYETSYETNSPQELGNDQVYDNTFSGKLSSVLFPSLTSVEKVYDFNIDTISQETVYDMDNTDNNIYGDYY